MCRASLLLVALLANGGCSAAPSDIRAPFPAVAAAAAASGDHRCARPVPPMVDMAGMTTFYKPTASASIIDRPQLTAYIRRVSSSAAFTKAMLEAQKTMFGNGPDRAAVAICVKAELARWAAAGAMLGNLAQNSPTGHRQAVLVMIWTGIAAASADLVASDVIGAQPADPAIRQWFGRLSDVVRAEFTPPAVRPRKERWLDATANHSHMAGAALGLFAAITQDRAALDHMKRELDRALAGARDDGGLPRELRRGQRAEQYQTLAVLAIALMVAEADANNLPLDAAQERKFAAITGFTADAAADPALVSRLTGVTQVKATPGWVAWMDVALPHLAARDPDLCSRVAALAAPTRPQQYLLIGLPTTLAFQRPVTRCGAR